MKEISRFEVARKRDGRGHFKKSTITAATRREIAARHGCTMGETVNVKCAYCDLVGSVHWFAGGGRSNSKGWVSFQNLEMDHSIPEYLGGPSTSANLVLACLPCNRSKGFKEAKRA